LVGSDGDAAFSRVCSELKKSRWREPSGFLLLIGGAGGLVRRRILSTVGDLVAGAFVFLFLDWALY